MSDPFWKKSGFWTAIAATVPLVYAFINKTSTVELVVAVVGAWGTFFTSAAVRGPVQPVPPTPPQP